MLTSDPKLQLIRFFHRLILESFWSSLCANNTGGTASNPPRTSDSSALFPASLRGFYSRFNCLVFFRAFESTGFRQLTFLTTSFFLGLRGEKKRHAVTGIHADALNSHAPTLFVAPLCLPVIRENGILDGGKRRRGARFSHVWDSGKHPAERE